MFRINENILRQYIQHQAAIYCIHSILSASQSTSADAVFVDISVEPSAHLDKEYSPQSTCFPPTLSLYFPLSLPSWI